MEIRYVQEWMKRMYYERDRARGLYATFAWLVEEVCRRLGGVARAGGLARVCKLEEAFREFTEYFESAVGSPPWGAQRTWARRLLRGDSFSIIAPTGVGKTTFGLVAALYLACSRGEKSYLVFPTTTL
ncbi:MAG TPA: hypothetical protein EYP08_07320, partial [Pyrodictiaceae archaeon]|nr:hypothetical protein [Pyrodictiaceae archaeon]